MLEVLHQEVQLRKTPFYSNLEIVNPKKMKKTEKKIVTWPLGLLDLERNLSYKSNPVMLKVKKISTSLDNVTSSPNCFNVFGSKYGRGGVSGRDIVEQSGNDFFD